jgi:hypothetical protein
MAASNLDEIRVLVGDLQSEEKTTLCSPIDKLRSQSDISMNKSERTEIFTSGLYSTIDWCQDERLGVRKKWI